jgi:hypothetical protein
VLRYRAASPAQKPRFAQRKGKKVGSETPKGVLARRSPRRAATRPEEARIGAEAVPVPRRPERALRGPERGVGRPQIAPTPPPDLLEPPAQAPWGAEHRGDCRRAGGELLSLKSEATPGKILRAGLGGQTFVFPECWVQNHLWCVMFVAGLKEGGPFPKGKGGEARNRTGPKGAEGDRSGRSGAGSQAPVGDGDRRDLGQGRQTERLVVRAAQEHLVRDVQSAETYSQR